MKKSQVLTCSYLWYGWSLLPRPEILKIHNGKHQLPSLARVCTSAAELRKLAVLFLLPSQSLAYAAQPFAPLV